MITRKRVITFTLAALAAGGIAAATAQASQASVTWDHPRASSVTWDHPRA